MTDPDRSILKVSHQPSLSEATLVLAFSGWMDGGDVSTGTVRRLVELTNAERLAEIDPEPFYIYNLPGPMELAALFRPHVEIQDGMIVSHEMPASVFYCHEPANLVLFIGKEPNMRWREFGKCILDLACQVGVRRILFVGSYGGSVPHTREPRMHVTCSEDRLLPQMQKYGVDPANYEGPGSFVSYLMTQTPAANLEMVSLVAEIPAYLHGANPASLEAVTRRLAKILKLPLELDSLRAESTRWELDVSNQVEKDDELAAHIRKLEAAYDDQLLERDSNEEQPGS